MIDIEFVDKNLGPVWVDKVDLVTNQVKPKAYMDSHAF